MENSESQVELLSNLLEKLNIIINEIIKAQNIVNQYRYMLEQQNHIIEQIINYNSK
jgi:hypothetical protein